jgi:hypothetical protein
MITKLERSNFQSKLKAKKKTSCIFSDYYNFVFDDLITTIHYSLTYYISNYIVKYDGEYLLNTLRKISVCHKLKRHNRRDIL